MAASSRPRPSLVTRLEPTLTTMRWASASTRDSLLAVISASASHTGPRAQEHSGLRGFCETGIYRDRGLLGHLLRLHVLVDGLDQGLTTFTRQRRYLKDRALVLVALDEILDQGGSLVFGHHVQLVQNQPARLLVKRLIVLLQLTHNGLGLSNRIDGFVKGRQIHHVQQQTRALQVTQEQMPQTRPFGGPLDQTRDV